ncbi:MAG: GerMN domain-containing protein [Acidobacteriota bacterium]
MKARGWVTVAILAVAVAALGIFFGQRSGDDPEEPGIETPDAPVADEALVLEPAELFFPGSDGRLHRHQQNLPAGDVRARAETLVRTLLEGPGGVVDGSLRPPLPDGTTLGGVHLIDGAAYIDLRSETLAGPPASGSLHELLTVYSLVNTLGLGLEGVERVVLLWNGAQPETFGGHLDTSRPLAPDTRWVADS